MSTICKQLLAAAACVFLVNELALAAEGPVKHLVIVSLDGMRPDTYVHPEAHQVRMPTLRKMVEQGCASTGVKGVFPTVTYPSHTAMMTGQFPGTHGIIGNTPLDPFNLTMGGWFYYAEQIKTPTLWQLVKEHGGTTAAVSWPVTVGAKIDYLIPEYRPVRIEDDMAMLRALSTPGLIEGMEAKLGKTNPSNVKDDFKADAASYIFAKYKPTLLLLHLAETDHAEHVDGPDSAAAAKVFEETDARVAKLKSEIESAAGSEGVAWMIVSDHGFQNVRSQVNIQIPLSKAGLVEYGKDNKVSSWRVYPIGGGGSFALVAKDQQDKEAIAKATEEFKTLAANPQNGIKKLYTADELKAMDAYPGAFLAGDMEEGFATGAAHAGDLVTPSTTTKGTHGYDPSNPKLYASFIVAGDHAAHCDTMAPGELVDVGPTAAAMLGFEFPGVKGHVHQEAIQGGASKTAALQ